MLTVVSGLVTGFTSNLALISYATLFLTIRLLALRKLMVAYKGDEVPLTERHLRMVTVLLESAAINIPVAIAAIVGIMNDTAFGVVLGLVVPPAQVCATRLM